MYGKHKFLVNKTRFCQKWVGNRFGELSFGRHGSARSKLEFPMSFIPFTKSISFSQEYISGDKYHLGGSDGVLSGFAKPFGAGHAFHGYYDNPLHKKFANNSHAGLSEWFIKTKHEIFPDLNLVVKYHSFKDAIDVNTYGQELDFVLSKKLPLGGKVVQGYSAYFTEDGDRLDFGYFMLVFNI